jgi:hypothetical protein
MDHVLDRYIDLLYGTFVPYPIAWKAFWNSEHHLRSSLMDVFGLCLVDHGDVFMMKLRRVEEGSYDNYPTNRTFFPQWTEVKHNSSSNTT